MLLERLISWSLGHRISVLCATLMVGVVGVLALRALNIDAFPDTTPVQVQINCHAAALVPEEIERQITLPVELAMGGLPRLEQMRSLSMFGLSQVVVTFRDGTDIYFARQLINERMGSVQLPPGIDRPQMGPISTGLGEVFHYFLSSRTGDLAEPRTVHDRIVKPLMRPVPGTAEVNSWGGFEKQYQVRLDPTRLLKFNLTFEQVMNAVCENNLNVGGGSINRAGDMLLVHGVGRPANTEQIGQIVLQAREGVAIRVRDVADVVIGHEIRRGAVTATTRDPHDPSKLVQGEVVLGLGFMLMGQNSYAVTQAMRDKFDSLRSTLPPQIETFTAYDRTQLVDRVLDTVKNNLLEGATLVVLILYVFLGNLRAGLICAVAIPLALLVGFCGMWWAGIAGSLLSLGAIDFGVVVDSSVVVIENILRRLAHAGNVQGWQRIMLIRDAAVEVRVPACFGQLIIMIVYIPILTLEGVEGKMFRPMAWSVIFVLIGSLVCSLTLTPVLASYLLPRRVAEEDVFLVRQARRIYEPVLRGVLQWRWVVVGASLLALAGTFWLAMGLGAEFVPRLSEGAIVVGIVRPPGTSLDECLRINQRMERLLLEKFPNEVERAWSRAGSPEVPTDASTVEVTDLFVTLQPRENWTRAHTQSELVELMEQELIDIPGQTIWFTQPIEQRLNEMVSGARADVALKLFGKEFSQLALKARELEKVLKSVPGCVDLATEQMLGQPILRIAIKQDQIARYGIPAQKLLDVVESIGSKSLGEVVESRFRFPLVVRLPESLRESPESISSILIAAPSGERIPLSRLADIQIVDGPRLISREWNERRVAIQCNVRGRDVGGFVAEAQRRIASEVQLPEGFRTDWGGQFENMQRAQRRLIIVVPLALALIVGLLYLSFRNGFDTLAIFAGVPFACMGGVLGLWWREMPFSISAAVGFITLSGVSVLNSMVLVSSLRNLLVQMIPMIRLSTGILQAGSQCLRTILMTALVASVGFVPMATSTSAGAEVQRPLATVVIGGVVTSTLFTLCVLPTLYLWLGRRR